MRSYSRLNHGSLLRNGLTLVEVMTVVAILIVLAALISSVIVRSKVKGHEAKCIGNLRSLGTAIELYSADSDQRLPYNIYVNYDVLLHHVPRSVFRCPADPSSGLNRSAPTHQKLPTSYYPIPSIVDGFEDALTELDPNYTVFVCFLHGEKKTFLRDGLTDTSGTVLRLRRDGSVTRKQSTPKCWIGTDNAMVVGRDFWHVFSDAPAPPAILEGVLGIRGPKEVPCR